MSAAAGDSPPRDLARLERWVQAVIMHPGGVAQGAASVEARAELGGATVGVDDLVERSRALTATERLSIYNRAYFARLVECLAEQFSVLRQTMGDELFGEFALAYLVAYPSQSYTLGRLGERFSNYLIETRPPRRDDEAAGPGWPEFLVDLAELEWAIAEVFDGPGTENEPTLDTARLQSISTAEWPSVRFVMAPCLRLLTQRFPVNEFYGTVRKENRVPEFPAATESFMALSRRQYVVRRFPLVRAQYEVLAALVAGETVGSAIERAAQVGFEHDPNSFDFDQLAGDLRQWFSQWSAEEFFMGTSVPVRE
ncbi:MAG: putative DNA-binding domain-containing protein [Pirellulales bacterium]|nr:putative DNA-binding domain-containing protein [Pirellulales bacterium]